MADTTTEVIYSDDYSRLFAYQSRQFTAGDISLRYINGVQWMAAAYAVATAVLCVIFAFGVLLLLGMSVWWVLLAFFPPLVLVYVRLAKERTGGLTEIEKRYLALNFRYRQPRDLLGLTANTEPIDFEWDVIFWSPTALTAAGGTS